MDQVGEERHRAGETKITACTAAVTEHGQADQHGVDSRAGAVIVGSTRPCEWACSCSRPTRREAGTMGPGVVTHFRPPPVSGRCLEGTTKRSALRGRPC